MLGPLPNAALAAIVIVCSVGLIQPSEFRAIRGVRKMEFRWALIACLGVLETARHAGLDQRLGRERLLFNAREAIERYQAMQGRGGTARR